MSYWKQFTAASAAIAAAHIRAMTDVPQSVKDFAAGEIERINPMGTGEGFVLVVNLTGHSPSGQPYYQTATCKLEAVWMVAAIAPPVDTADKPVEREIPRVSGGRAAGRPSGRRGCRRRPARRRGRSGRWGLARWPRIAETERGGMIRPVSFLSLVLWRALLA